MFHRPSVCKRLPTLQIQFRISESKAICFFFHARRRKAWFPLRMSIILFAAKHSWTTLLLSRPLFVGSYSQVTWWAFGRWKGRHQMIIKLIGRGWAKYRDLSVQVVSRSIICQSRKKVYIQDQSFSNFEGNTSYSDRYVPTSKDFTYMRALFNLFRNVMNQTVIHNLCFSFLLGITAVPREIETMLTKNLAEGGVGGK